VAPVCDGVSYWHTLRDRDGVVSALWCNPSERDGFPAQSRLVSEYARLLATAQLTSRSVQLAFGIDGELERPDPSRRIPARTGTTDRGAGRTKSG
jgi:hypothetical protein